MPHGCRDPAPWPAGLGAALVHLLFRPGCAGRGGGRGWKCSSCSGCYVLRPRGFQNLLPSQGMGPSCDWKSHRHPVRPPVLCSVGHLQALGDTLRVGDTGGRGGGDTR